MKTRYHIMLLATLAMLVAGCGPEPDAPERAMTDLIDALTRGDRGAVIASYAVTGKQAEVVGAMFDLRQAARKMDAKVTGTFGRTAGRHFKVIEIPFEAIASSTVGEYTFTPSGYIITFTGPANGSMTMVDSLWKLDYTQLPTSDARCDAVIRKLSAITELYEGITIEAGKRSTSLTRLKSMFESRKATLFPKRIRSQLPRATTPEQTLENMRAALLAGDREGFLSVYDANEAQRRFLSEVYNSVQATRTLDKAVLEAFGPEGAATFGLDFEEMMSGMRADRVVYNEDGMRAAVTPKAGTVSMLNKIDGVWLMDPSAGVPTDPGEFKAGISQLQTQRRIFEEVAAEAAKPGMTPEKLQEILGKRIMQAVAVEDLRMQQMMDDAPNEIDEGITIVP